MSAWSREAGGAALPPGGGWWACPRLSRDLRGSRKGPAWGPPMSSGPLGKALGGSPEGRPHRALARTVALPFPVWEPPPSPAFPGPSGDAGPGRPWWRLQERWGRLRAAGRVCPRWGLRCPQPALNTGPGRTEGRHPQAEMTATVGPSSVSKWAQEQAGPARPQGWQQRTLPSPLPSTLHPLRRQVQCPHPQTPRGHPRAGPRDPEGGQPLPPTRRRPPRVSSPVGCRWQLLVVTRVPGDTPCTSWGRWCRTGVGRVLAK